MSTAGRQLWSSGYHPPLPIRLELDNGKSAVCEQVVRAMPGRRYVCRGSYDDRSAFIKLFAMNRRARREWQDEQAGIAALHAAGIAAPEILYAGVLGHGETRLVVYAVLHDAVSARQCWEQGDETARRQLLADLVGLVARHHAAGLRQADLHLLNFVYSEATLYTLDAADIRQSAPPLSRADSVAGLADLLALLPVEYDRLAAEAYQRYWRARGEEASSGEHGVAAAAGDRQAPLQTAQVP